MARPTLYDPTLCDQLDAYFAKEPWTEAERTIERRDGSTVTEMVRHPCELPTLAGFACQIGVHRDTLHEWTKIHPEFSDAIKRAKAHQERILVGNGLCGLYEGPFGIFTAKNVLGWRDKQDIDLGSDPDRPLIAKVVREIVRPPNRDG